jgi:hypothetical protein
MLVPMPDDGTLFPPSHVAVTRAQAACACRGGGGGSTAQCVDLKWDGSQTKGRILIQQSKKGARIKAQEEINALSSRDRDFDH